VDEAGGEAVVVVAEFRERDRKSTQDWV